MTRPTSVRIMGQRFKVGYHLDPKEPIIYGGPEEMEVGEQAMGYTNAVLQHIVVRGEPASSFHQERDTLLHECLHGMFALTGLDAEMSEAKAEALITRLSPAILTLLRDNPRLVKHLTEAKCA